MSALTDLFTALANKIRSKTGGSDTYTPPEMVAAIDDVYDAGVAAGTTPTQTKTVTAGTSATTVTPDQGYALSSVTVNPTPTQSKTVSPGANAQTVNPDAGYHLSSVKVNGILTQTKISRPNVSTNKTIQPDTGYLLDGVVIQPLIHSDTYTPAVDTSANDMGEYHDKRYVDTSGMIIPSGNKAITANGSGIDVKSFSTVSVNVPSPTLDGDATTANVLAGKTFYSNSTTKLTGTMTNQGSPTRTIPAGGSSYFGAGYYSGGYVYAGSSTPTISETELWTNNAPTSDFSSGTQTVSNMSSYKYIKVYYKPTKSSSAVYSTIFDREELVTTHSGSNYVIGCVTSSSVVRARRFRANSATQVNFTACYRVDGTAEGSQAGSIIPTKITGIKIS